MPSEPDNKMDELLRTYARKRREDAGEPPALHPATRRLLQAEAAKLRPPAQARPLTIWAWLLAHWPRVAVSVGVFTVLAAVVWNVLPGKERAEFQLAKQDATYNAPAHSRDKNAASADQGVLADHDNNSSERSRRASQPTAPNALAESIDVAKRGLRPDTESKREQEMVTTAKSLQDAPDKNAAKKDTTWEAQVALQSADSGAKDFFFARGQAADRFALAPTGDVTLGAKLSLAPPPGPASERMGESLFTLPPVSQARPSTSTVYFSDSAAGLGGGRGGLGVSKPGSLPDSGSITSTALAFGTGTEGLGRRLEYGVNLQPGVPPVTGGAGPRGRARFAGGLATAEERDGSVVTGASPAGGVLLAKDATQPPARSLSLAADGEIKSKALLARQETLREARTGAIAPPASAPLAAVPPPRLMQRAAPPAAPSVASATPAPAPIDGLAAAPAGSTTYYRFRRLAEAEGAVAAKKEPSPAAVLSTFDFEQDGDHVRVIDSDGSVYAGRLLTPAEAGEARFSEFTKEARRVQTLDEDRRKTVVVDAAKKSPAREAETRSTPGMAFRVTGTNRASGQIISLEAALSGGAEAGWARKSFAATPGSTPTAPANRPIVAPAAKAPASLKAESAPAPTESPAAQRLVGRLRVGTAGEVPIIAVPVAK